MEKTSDRSRYIWVALLFGLFAVATDQITKWWAVRSLVPTEEQPLIGSFISLQLIRNPGAAFSFGSSSTVIFTVLSVVILGGIIWWIVSGRVNSMGLAIILGFIAGGAVGNLIDRLVQEPGFGRGHVIDFLNYNDWFIGNVADIWIVGGAIALIIWVIVGDTQTNE